MRSRSAIQLLHDGSIDRRTLLRYVAHGGLAAALGASAGGPAFAQQPAFKLGWIRPTTGRLASSFAPLYFGGLIAVDEINASGGILGRQIVRSEEDDEASPAKEPGITRKLREQDIGCVIGPTGSSQSLASLAATTPANMIQSAYAAAAEAGDGKRYPYHYQVMFNTDQQAAVCVDYMVNTLGVKKVGILQENTAFGEQAAASTKTVLQKKFGLTPVSEQVYPISAPDLSPYVANLQKAGAEGVVGWIANVPNAAMIFNAMKTLKWFPAVTGHSGLMLPALFDLVPSRTCSRPIIETSPGPTPNSPERGRSISRKNLRNIRKPRATRSMWRRRPITISSICSKPRSNPKKASSRKPSSAISTI
jgi:branched-chain amino acid transport system substrate-binding protein